MIARIIGKIISRCDTMNERVHTIHERGDTSYTFALGQWCARARTVGRIQTWKFTDSSHINLHNIRNVLIRTFDVHLRIRARIPFVHVHIPSYISYLTLSKQPFSYTYIAYTRAYSLRNMWTIRKGKIYVIRLCRSRCHYIWGRESRIKRYIYKYIGGGNNWTNPNSPTSNVPPPPPPPGGGGQERQTHPQQRSRSATAGAHPQTTLRILITSGTDFHSPSCASWVVLHL